jgi:hypothetical protein
MADKVRVDAQTGSQNWQSGFGSSGAKYQRGVEGVSSAPNAKAAAALPRWIASVTSKATQDKFVAKNNAVTLESWKSATVQFGVPNLSRGAQKGQTKYAAFATKFYPFLSSTLSKINAMPNVTLEDRIARATELMRSNAAYKG